MPVMLVTFDANAAIDGTYFYPTDHLATPRALTAADTGLVAWRAWYEPYGKMHEDCGVNGDEPCGLWQPLRFPGQWEDVDAGFYYNWHRFYLPEWGLYNREDPIFGVGAGLWGYVGGNPVSLSDPMGLEEWSVELGTAVVGAVDFLSFGATEYARDAWWGTDHPWSFDNDDPGDPVNEDSTAYKVGFWGAAAASLTYAGYNIAKLLKSWQAGKSAAAAADSCRATGAAGQGAKGASKLRGQANAAGEHGTFYVDPKGNVVPTPKGGKIAGSPDGRFIQAKDVAGKSTGVRIDGPHNPVGHSDPRALAPHGHVPGRVNTDGTPWLPMK